MVLKEYVEQKKDEPAPTGRDGRKRKADTVSETKEAPAKKTKTDKETPAEPKKGGRGKKAAEPVAEAVEETPVEASKKGGKGKKSVVFEVEQPTPAPTAKKVGRPKKAADPASSIFLMNAIICNGFPK